MSKRYGPNKWAGMEVFRLYRDGKGEWFPNGARYVVFDNNALVGEFDTLTKADKAFEDGVRVEGGIRKQDYIGIDEKLRNLVPFKIG
jgi:hypothetical protein